MKLLKIVPSDRPEKKYKAVFEQGDGSSKTIHFGADGYKDFISSKGNEVKKKAYIARHSVNERWYRPDTAGALSRWVLWNKPTLNESIKDYKKRFNL